MKLERLLLFIFLCLTNSLIAQRTISGVIKSGDNQERLPFADVIIKGTTDGTSTNVDGHFSLFNVPEDTLTLQVLYVGFTPAEISIDAGTEDITNLEVQL